MSLRLRFKSKNGRCAMAAALALVLAACGPGGNGSSCASSTRSPETQPFLDGTDPREWVTIYDPRRAANGYTLALYGRRIPIVIDMNGRVVHSWPEARVKSRIRLLPDGSLLGLALGRAIVEYDWDGTLVWEVPIEGAIPHHDVIRLANGNTMVLILREGERTDDILEINRAGKTVWEWRSGVELAGYYDPESPAGEITHLNSVQELPANRWFDAGDLRFRPANLLISARNLDAVFLVDRESGHVVWSYRHELDRQHEALMIGPDLPGAGNILIFDNGYASRHVYRKSRILEIDPSDNSIVWSYQDDGFYSPTGGVEQPLRNGNVLISSTRGGRAFEIDRAGRVVWQWVPPFEPNRPSRVDYRHCPQLAALNRPRETPVRPPGGYRHVDPRVYVYARSDAIAAVRIDGVERQALKQKNSCALMFVPPSATMRLGFGINGRGVSRSGRTGYRARFGVTAGAPGESEATVLLDEILDLEQTTWRERTLRLDEYALRWIEICLSIEGAGPPSETEPTAFAYWTNPQVVREAAAETSVGDTDLFLTPEEAEVQREHLRALGYID